MLVILILVMRMSEPRSTDHQWLSSGADQKHVFSVRRPSTASPGEWSSNTLLEVAGGGIGEGGEEGEILSFLEECDVIMETFDQNNL